MARQHGAVKLLQAVSPIIDLIYPPRCPLCGEGLAVQQGLCGACWGKLVIPGEPACATCQRPFGGGGVQAGAICAPCLASPPRHDGVTAGTLYNDTARKLVLSYKHGGRIALAPMLARLMAAHRPILKGTGSRCRSRFIECDCGSAASTSRRCWPGEIAHVRGAGLCVDRLIRRKATAPLGGLGKAARAWALSGAIALDPRRADMIRGTQILLVDDVVTSGATSDACVRALKQGGADKVRIVCFARVLDEAL